MKSKEYQALPAGTKVVFTNPFNGNQQIGIVCKRREQFRKGITQYNVVSFDGHTPSDINEKYLSLPTNPE